MKSLDKDDERDIRAVTYGCDGVCYDDTKICPRVDCCPETRKNEGCALLIVVLVMLLMFIGGIIALVWWLCEMLV